MVLRESKRNDDRKWGGVAGKRLVGSKIIKRGGGTIIFVVVYW